MDIRVEINDEVEQQILSHDEVGRLVRHVLAGEGCPEPCEVSVSFVTADEIHELNRAYRGIDRPTDVLSFNIDDPGDFDDPDEGFDGAAGCPCDGDDSDGDECADDGCLGGESDPDGLDDAFDDEGFDGEGVFMLGDVIVCPEVVEGQAAGFGNSVADEARLLLVHGCLHLMGYDHEEPSEAEEMEALERGYLAVFASVPADELNVGPTVDHAAEGSAAVCRDTPNGCGCR